MVVRVIDETKETPETPAQTAPAAHEAVPPIQSRFLFVNVAAQRAKQLRRGALPRIRQLDPDPVTGHRPEMPTKSEHVAMEEVRHGLIPYTAPDGKRPAREEGR